MKFFYTLIIYSFSLYITSVQICPDNAEEDWHDCIGSYQYPDGETYSGEWKNNAYYKGIIVYQNGDRYIGEFKENLRHGVGTYQLKNGELYVGDWIAGKRNGKGTYVQTEGEWETHIYVGGFKEDKKDGWMNKDDFR